MARSNAFAGDLPAKARLSKNDDASAALALPPQFDGSANPDSLISLFRDPAFSGEMAQAIFERLSPRIASTSIASEGYDLQALRELHARMNAWQGGLTFERRHELFAAMSGKLHGAQMARFALAAGKGADALAVAQAIGHLPYDKESTLKKIDFSVAIVQSPRDGPPDAPAIAAEHVLANSAVLRDGVVFNGILDGLALDGSLERVIGTHFKPPPPGNGSCDQFALAQIVEAAQRIGHRENWQAVREAVDLHFARIGQATPVEFTTARFDLFAQR